MEAANASSVHPVTSQAIAEIADSIARSMPSPDVLVVAHTVTHDGAEVVRLLNQRFPQAKLQGGTSFHGVLTEQGFFGREGVGLGVLALSAGGGALGIAIEDLDPHPRAAAKRAAEHAIADAGRPGQLPDALWIIVAPGHEEEVIAGITEVVGDSVPLVGGCSADNDFAGVWQQLGTTRATRNGVSVLAIFTDAPIASAFHCGYDATAHRGRVTECDRRTIKEIDGQPAAKVYDRWTGGAISAVLKHGEGNVHGPSNLFPIGKPIGNVAGIDYFCLSHPTHVNRDNHVTVFTDMQVGDEIVCMRGSEENLARRVSLVVRSAKEHSNLGDSRIGFALVIFCAGCYLTVKPRMEEVREELRRELGDARLLTFFTFGEQGHLLGKNRHGNLMISSLLIGRD